MQWKKPDAIVLAASDYNLLVPLAAEIRSRGIALVCIDSFIHSNDANVRIGTDSYEGGQKCAIALMRYIRPGRHRSCHELREGELHRHRPGIRRARHAVGQGALLDTQYSDSDADKAYLQASFLIRRVRTCAALSR